MASENDDVQLPDLEVIQRYSLAVRGATAPRGDVIAALQADLAWLSGGRRKSTAVSTSAKVMPAAPRTRLETPKPVAPSAPAPRPAQQSKPGAAEPAAESARTQTPAASKASTRQQPAKRGTAKQAA